MTEKIPWPRSMVESVVNEEQAFYLINELAYVLEHTNLATWPEHRRRRFRERMTEINDAVSKASK